MKPLQLRPRTAALVGLYLVLLHAVLAFVLLKTNFVPLARKTLGLAPPEERNVALYQAMLQWPARDVQVPAGAIVVLGDSLLQDLSSEQLGREVHSFALGGTTASTLLEGLALVPSVQRARAIVLGVGANDLKYRDPEGVACDYASVLAALPAHIDVIAVPVLPIDEHCAAIRERPYLSNERIARLDHLLEGCCAGRPRTRRVDISELVDSDGGLRPDLHAGDGWHLSDAGDLVLGRAIARELDALGR